MPATVPASSDTTSGTPAALNPVMSLHILLVEDHPDGAESCALWLGMLGHRVRVAGCCAAALRAVGSFALDVAILDIGLPDGGGYELAGKLVAALARRPLLVALTGFGNFDDRSRAAGFDHHLLKPADPPVLAALLAGHAAAHRGL